MGFERGYCPVYLHMSEASAAAKLILFGEHDKVVPPQNANLLAEKIPNSKVQILTNAGHFFPIEVPETASDAITQFLG